MNAKRQTLTPKEAIENWYKVPSNIREKAQKKICVVDYYNPDDKYWRKKYKGFKHSYATGGDEITFYRYEYRHDLDYLRRTYCHEAGHYIDITLPDSSAFDRYSEQTDWTSAMSDDFDKSNKKSVTKYGKNSKSEDFAESIAEFVENRDNFESEFPNRAKILIKILEGDT